jgi:leucyl-tRNA synthetase
LFGVTFIALAPQHPLAKLAAEKNPALEKFLEECRNVKVSEADLATLTKKGVGTDIFAIHPLTQDKIPVYVANFVLMDYGSGAVMAVPAHDERDFEFAQQYNIKIQPVVEPLSGTWDYSKSAFIGAGTLINSEQFDGLDTQAALRNITAYLVEQHKGSSKINFRLRDWSVSRQRYWGTPVPIINCPDCGAVAATDLPVVLPEQVNFDGVTSPLKTMPEFLNTTCPKCGKPAQRETDTFDTFFESSWYYARFACKKQDNAMLDGRANYWVPVDQYVGGIEHAVMHLLYARFIHKLMRDEGLLNSDEPFTRLLTQGMVLNQGIKMSKSKGNTVDPQNLIDTYGTDTVRLFTMFAAPPEQSLEWSDTGVEGAHRFLRRVWTLAYEHREDIKTENAMRAAANLNWDTTPANQRDVLRQVYDILEQAKYDYERLQFNTVVSGCMKLLNLLAKIPEPQAGETSVKPLILHKGMSILLRLLAPIAPHIAHQLWHDLSYEGVIINAPWPKGSATALKSDHIELVIQINGKLRSKIKAPSGAATKTIEELALNDAKVQHAMIDKTVKKIITVPGKLVNIVTEEN